MLLAKTKKLKGGAINKKEKLAHAANDLNENVRQFEVAKEEQRRLMAKIESYYECKLEDARHKQQETMHEFQKTSMIQVV